MRRLLLAGAIAVVTANGEVVPEEIAAFEKLFGTRAFSNKLDHVKLRNELPERIEQMRTLTSLPQRMQVLRDLITIARSDGPPPEAERKVLVEIAHGLGISTCFIDQSMNMATELD